MELAASQKMHFYMPKFQFVFSYTFNALDYKCFSYTMKVGRGEGAK